MNLRPAQLEDVPAVMRIVRTVVPAMRASGNLQWDDVYPNSEVFAEDIAHGHLWVAEIESRIAGVVALTTDQSPEYVQAGWDIKEPAIVVHRLAVDPAFQGRGVAIALMRQAEVVAEARGIGRVRVDTNTHNQVTQRLLPKMGYELSGEIGLHFRPGLRFFCYEKVIAASCGGDENKIGSPELSLSHRRT
jgi:ribosomal protein S18 acetylase RimI-like enzyme